MLLYLTESFALSNKCKPPFPFLFTNTLIRLCSILLHHLAHFWLINLWDQAKEVQFKIICYKKDLQFYLIHNRSTTTTDSLIHHVEYPQTWWCMLQYCTASATALLELYVLQSHSHCWQFLHGCNSLGLTVSGCGPCRFWAVTKQSCTDTWRLQCDTVACECERVWILKRWSNALRFNGRSQMNLKTDTKYHQ